MRTTSWQPSAAHSPAMGIGLTQRLNFSSAGEPDRQLSAVAALYLACAYLQNKLEFMVSTLDGEELCHNRGGKLVNADESFGEALYLMDQFSTQSFNQGMAKAVADMEAIVAERDREIARQEAEEQAERAAEASRSRQDGRGQDNRGSDRGQRSGGQRNNQDHRGGQSRE